MDIFKKGYFLKVDIYYKWVFLKSGYFSKDGSFLKNGYLKKKDIFSKWIFT